jgi:hypothetical protein
MKNDSFSDLLTQAHRRSPATISAEAQEKLSITADSPRPGTYCKKMNMVFATCTFFSGISNPSLSVELDYFSQNHTQLNSRFIFCRWNSSANLVGYVVVHVS